MKVTKRARLAQHAATGLAVLAAFAFTPAAAESPLGARPLYGTSGHAATASAREQEKASPRQTGQAVEARDLSATDVQGKRENGRMAPAPRDAGAAARDGIGYRLGP